MASHYKLYDGLNEVVPFGARYTYPTQANRSWKQNIKIPTTNGQRFYPGGSNPQILLPAQGYLNTRNTFLSCDIKIVLPAGADVFENVRFQNGIQSIWNRLQLRYGSLSLEDLREAGVLTRMMTEATGSNVNGVMDQSSIAEGIGGMSTMAVHNFGGTSTDADNPDLEAATTDFKTGMHLLNVRVNCIQTANFTVGSNASCEGIESKSGGETAARSRRYQFQLPFGMFQQNKLIPLKWMASQLTIEASLNGIASCMVGEAAPELPAGTTYILENVCLNAELLEFDGSYDAAFLEGLRGDGVPIKFASWDTFMYTPAPGKSQTLQIPERNRSLKAAFCVQIPPASSAHEVDSHAFVMSSAAGANGPSGHVVDYQWRIGGKYYPAQPVTCGDGTYVNGGAEAYRELEKALNIVGDYRLSTSVHAARWCRAAGPGGAGISQIRDWPTTTASGEALIRGTELGPSYFVIALDMETSSGAEVSGLNGEEQNDISLRINYSDNQDSNFQYLVFVYYDALLVLRENNLVELIK